VGFSIILYFVVWMPPTILGIVFLWRSGRALEVLHLATRDTDASGNMSR